MGVMNHNAIIATTWSKDSFRAAETWIAEACKGWQFLFALTGEVDNGYRSIVMVPDGSKEGWERSAVGDGLRERFIAFLESHTDEDGSSPWCWVEVGFGEFGQALLRGNNRNEYSDSPWYPDDAAAEIRRDMFSDRYEWRPPDGES